MLGIWVIMYYNSLISLELNLQAGRGLSLAALGRQFSGKIAGGAGFILLKLLSYALLAIFIYGGSSILQKLLETEALQAQVSFLNIATGFASIAAAILLLPIKIIDYINRVMFIGLLAIVAILILGLFTMIDWTHIPLFSEHYDKLSSWQSVIPVVFMSFGFQVIFHTLTNYCNSDAKMLKKAFFWGSLIPAIVYIIWTSSVLSVMSVHHPEFYAQMAVGNVEVGDLIQQLTTVTQWPAVNI